MEPGSEEQGSSGLVGGKLGRYEVRGELGRGGMAVVYRAFDPQLGREVALKVLHAFFVGRVDMQERFRREAQAVAALKHHAVVEIYDFAPDEGARPAYIVSELVRGPTLRQVAEGQGGRLLPEVAALCVAPVADALDAAHARGIVHRDVKPDNVMIDCPGEGSRVLLADFGVARMAGSETMTATGALVGSPAYMSPEQASGHDVGPASDIFSLGAMLYHLCTGRLPFEGGNPLTLIAAIMRCDVKRPSQLSAHISVEFDGLVRRCLGRQPETRPARAADVARDLRAVAAAAGLTDGARDLARFFSDGAAFDTELRRRVAGSALHLGRAAVRRGNFGRALAEANRVFAYQPDSAAGKALLRSISTRRYVVRGTGVAAVLLLMAGGAYFAANRVPSVPPAPGTSAGVASAVPAFPVPASPVPASPVPEAAAPTVSSPPLRSVRPPAIVKSKGSKSAVAVEADMAAAPELPTHDDAAKAAPAAEPVARGTISLRARWGMCTPSIDDAVPGELQPVYENLPPGLHRVFCSDAGVRHAAGTVDLPAGKKLDLVISREGDRFTLKSGRGATLPAGK